MTVAVCLKWVVPPGLDDRFGSLSPADEAALEWALRSSAERAEPLLALTAGDAGADRALRIALASGADDAVRVDAPPTVPSAHVAGLLAAHLRDATLVWCGDYSLDRGTGSTPAFLAAQLGVGQALGLVSIEVGERVVTALRRLDGGRRERVRVSGRAVLSVEGATAALRRAPLPAVLAAGSAPIRVSGGGLATDHERPPTRPYRPRPRVLSAPRGDTLDRVRSLLASGAPPRTHGAALTLDPPAAAARIIDSLTEWGYLP
jgi:electron transfer flavoprotein beta subunit